MADSTNKVITTENLGTFKTQMEVVIDNKIAEIDGATIEYATEDDIVALFSDTTTGTDDTDDGSDVTE